MVWRKRFYFVAILFAVHTVPAQAVLVTWVVSGETTIVFDQVGSLSDVVQVGSPFRVKFSFDPMNPDIRPDAPSSGWYEGVVLDMSGFVGGVAFSGTGLFNFIRVGTQDPEGNDHWSLEIQGLFIPILGQQADLNIWLTGGIGDVFLDDSLPVVVPDLASFDSNGFDLQTKLDASDAFGEIHAITPEPQTLWLVGIGAAYIFKRRRASNPGCS